MYPRNPFDPAATYILLTAALTFASIGAWELGRRLRPPQECTRHLGARIAGSVAAGIVALALVVATVGVTIRVVRGLPDDPGRSRTVHLLQERYGATLSDEDAPLPSRVGRQQRQVLLTTSAGQRECTVRVQGQSDVIAVCDGSELPRH